MGQTMLQGCQLNCRGQDFPGKSRGKYQIYLNGMLNQLPGYSQKENLMQKSIQSTTTDNNFLMQIKNVPYQYLSFVNHLFVTRNKYEDKLFPINELNSYNNSSENNYIRVSEITQQLAKLCAYQTATKSRTILLLQHLSKNIPEILQKLRPIYIDKVGIAICKFYLNGLQQQVIIDDRVPLSNVKFLARANYWFLLVEKGMAKAVGNYVDLQKFSLSQLYQEITGLFLQPMQEQSQQDLLANNQTTFKEGIKYEKQCCIAGQKNQVYRVYLFKNYIVRSLSLKNNKKYNLFRLKVEQTQKISIRLSVLNWKYQYSSQQTPFRHNFHISLYLQQNSSLVTSFNKILGNNVYVGLKTILDVQKGSYLILVKGEEVTNVRANLVYYASENVCLRQIISKEGAKLAFRKINISFPINDTF